MMMTLREARQAIRSFIRGWSDQKVAEVYAFNRDRKMRFEDSCGCIRGVTLSDVLHDGNSVCNMDHYDATRAIVGASEAECGYGVLGRHRVPAWLDNFGARRIRLSAILRAELRRRDRLRATSLRQHDTEIAILLAAGGRMKRLDVSDIEGASDLMEDPTGDLASIMLHGATVSVREGGNA